MTFTPPSEYHDHYLKLIVEHFGVDLKGKHIGELTKTDFDAMPAEPRKYALGLRATYVDIECEVWMTRSSYDTKPFRKSIMEIFGATVDRSPSSITASGRKTSWTIRSPGSSASRSVAAGRSGRRGPGRRTRWAACSTTSCCTRP